MEFRAGASRVEITPSIGSPTRRWPARDEGARIKEIRWPLYARTVALTDGSRTTTVTSMEICVLHKTHLDHIRELARGDLPESVLDIMLHCTHQHSDSFVEYEPSYDIFGINDTAFDMDYVRSIAPRVAESIRRAVEAMVPVHFACATGAVEEGIASCRRVITDERGLVWRSSRPAQALRDLPRGHIDPEVGVAAFTDLDGNPVAIIYNYACHPSAAGGDSPNVCTADYPGYASAMIEHCYGGVALFLHGCSGDINPAKYVRGDPRETEHRVADARRMGRILAGEVLKTLGLAAEQEVRHLASVQEDCLLPVQAEAGDVELNLRNARTALEEWRKTGSDPRTALRKYVLSRKVVGGKCPVTVGAVAINGLGIAFIPGEPFTAFGEQIKKGSRTEPTLVASTSGEEPFYIPTPEAFLHGGYETGYVATAQTGTALVQAALGLLESVARPGP